MAQPKQLFDGGRRNINHALTAPGCPIKTTAQLCQQFKILWQFPAEVEEFAQTYQLARTHKTTGAPETPGSPPQNDALAAEEEAALAAAEAEVPAYEPPPRKLVRVEPIQKVVQTTQGLISYPAA